MPLRHTIRLLLLALGVVPLIGACASRPATPEPAGATAPGVELRYRWIPGRSITFEGTETVHESVRMVAETGEGGLDDQVLLADESTVEHETSQGRLEVVDVWPDGSARLRLVHDHFQVEAISPVETVRWDSSTAADDEATRELAADRQPLIDHPVSFTASVRGKVSDVEGADDALEALTGFVEPDLARAAVQDLLEILPPGPVVPGDTWSNPDQVTLPELGTLVGDDVYTLVGIETGDRGETLARIDYRGEYHFEAADQEVLRGSLGPELADLQMDVALDLSVGRAEGQVLFDVEAGVFRSATVEMALLFDMVFTPEGETDGPVPTITVSAEIEADSVIDYTTGDD